MMELKLSANQVEGLGQEEQKKLAELIKVYDYHKTNNQIKNKYYEGHIKLDEVNLGIALPEGFAGLEIGCEWGAKTVDVLAARSMFDGFVGVDGDADAQLKEIVSANRLISEYRKNCRDELKYGCTFSTLAADPECGCSIRFHTPLTAAALWNGAKGRIDCGMAIIDTVPDESQTATWYPSLINLYTEDAIWVLERVDNTRWKATENRHRMGRPLMEPLIWNATSSKPFGRSRIKEPVRRLIQGYVRTIANATIGLEFSTAPQKYLLGVTDEQFDAVVNEKFRQYIGNIIAATTNPDTGEKPSFGQLMQGTLTPHVEMLRMLATQFSAATGLSVTDTGVVNDANPTSSDAILAQSQTLIQLAEDLNAGNGDSLRPIAVMALAIANNKAIDELDENQKDVIAHFKNPAMPSIAQTADAAMKIASSRQGFAGTDIFLEMVGFDQADIRRIKAQESRERGLAVLEEIENETVTEGLE